MDVNELLKYMKCHILDHWCIKPLLTKPQMWDAMRSPFKANHRKDSMFIMAISKWLQYNFVLEINNNMFVSRLMNHTITYKGQTETNNKSLINILFLTNKREMSHLTQRVINSTFMGVLHFTFLPQDFIFFANILLF